MAWIKFEKDLLTDPRLLRIARTLEASWVLDTQSKQINGVEFGNAVPLPAVTLVCGALIRLWSLADTHLREDDVLPLGITELDDLIGIPGMCGLLPSDWLLPIDDNSVKLPGFHEHNGTEAKKKAVTRKRVARFRLRNALALQAVTPDLVLPDQTIPDHKKIKRVAKETQKKTLPENWNPLPETIARLAKQFNFSNGDAERYVEAFRDACAAKGYTYANFDAAFCGCVRKDWPGFRNGRGTMPKNPDARRVAL